MESGWIAWATGLAFATGCVPPGSNTGSPDAAPAAQPIARAAPAVSAPPPPPSDVLRAPFEDDFSRTAQRRSAAEGSGSGMGASDLVPDWIAPAPGSWIIAGVKVC